MKKDLIAAEIRNTANWITFLFILFLITNFHTTFRSRVAIADVETETAASDDRILKTIKKAGAWQFDAPAFWQYKHNYICIQYAYLHMFNRISSVSVLADRAFKEICRCADQIPGILASGCLVRRMHGELRKSDIYGI